jgi:hypothetical protein
VPCRTAEADRIHVLIAISILNLLILTLLLCQQRVYIPSSPNTQQLVGVPL